MTQSEVPQTWHDIEIPWQRNTLPHDISNHFPQPQACTGLFSQATPIVRKAKSGGDALMEFENHLVFMVGFVWRYSMPYPMSRVVHTMPVFFHGMWTWLAESWCHKRSARCTQGMTCTWCGTSITTLVPHKYWVPVRVMLKLGFTPRGLGGLQRKFSSPKSVFGIVSTALDSP